MLLDGSQLIRRETDAYHRTTLTALRLPLVPRLWHRVAPGIRVVACGFDLLGKLAFPHDRYNSLPCRHLVNSRAELFQPVIGRRRSTSSRVTTATVSERPPWVSPSISHVAAKRSEEHTSELQSLRHLVCRLL